MKKKLENFFLNFFKGKIVILLIKSLDSDPNPDPHRSEMMDPDPKKIYVDPQH